MSYETTNRLPADVGLRKVIAVVELLGYVRLYGSRTSARYSWFDSRDYRSFTGVQLSIETTSKGCVVQTRTPIARSHFDLLHQNRTVRELRRLLGGTFTTDAGSGRYQRSEGLSPTPSQAGCHLAFQRFGHNLIRADVYLMNRPVLKEPWSAIGLFDFLDDVNPRILSNNLLVPYLVATLEDYFKSTFVALLSSSEKRPAFLRSARLTSEQLSRIADSKLTVEEAVAELLPFQSVNAVLNHFRTLDGALDLASELRRPVRRRKKSLLNSLEELVRIRHEFIHHANVSLRFRDAELRRSIGDLETAVTRCYRKITRHYGWAFEQQWGRGPTVLEAQPHKHLD